MNNVTTQMIKSEYLIRDKFKELIKKTAENNITLHSFFNDTIILKGNRENINSFLDSMTDML